MKKIGDIPASNALRGWLWSLLFVAGLAAPALAQRDDARVELTVNATDVQSGDMLRLSLTFVNCKVRDIDPPEVKGLEFRMGPSTSNSTSWVNGVTTSEQRYTYNYKVVGSGEISVPAQTWKTSEGPLKSNPVRLFASGRAQPSRTKSRNGTTQRQPARDLVTAIEPSKRTLYLGEPVVLNYKIYNRYNNLDVRNYDIPELDGFWKETVDMPDARWEPQLINGKRYNVATVRKIVAFPQQTGTIELKDFDLVGYMRVNFFEGRELTATCEPVTLEVLPLPEAAPANSLGTFAELSVTQKASLDSLNANEAVTVEVTYRGRGNLKFLQEPELVWPAEFEVFDAEVEDQINITAKGESGSRAFKFVAIPRAPGTYTLPGVEATYFNPLRAKHITSRAPALSLKVNAGEAGAGGVSFNHQQDVQVLNQDIRHIELEPSRFLPRGTWAWKLWVLVVLFLAGPATYGVAAWQRSTRAGEAQDRLGTRHKRALTVLNAQLKQGQSAEEVGEAMEQYLMAKLKWERSALTREAVHATLGETLPDLASEWDALWSALEMHRYGASAIQADDLAETLRSLAQRTEQAWT